MKIRLLPKIKPGSRASFILHGLFSVSVILVIYFLTVEPISLPIVGVVVFLLSKWRMFAVMPRHWLANVRSNLVDITVGVSYVIFIDGTAGMTTRLVLTALYIGWVLFLKPATSSVAVGVQAMIAQLVGMMAMYGRFSDVNILTLVLFTWLLCYSSARHFFSSFDEPDGRMMAHVWGLFGAQLAWVLGHWVLAYGPVPQIALLLTVIGYSFALSYYLKYTSKLNASQKNQFIIVTLVIILIVALFSQWQYNG